MADFDKNRGAVYVAIGRSIEHPQPMTASSAANPPDPDDAAAKVRGIQRQTSDVDDQNWYHW